jgi:thiol-disulfide isomerase/thioredoxin
MLELSACSFSKSDKNPHEGNNPLANKTIENFKATTLDGKEVTNEIFKANDLTIVNIWGTFCKPCIEEMPDLEKLSNEYKNKKVQVVGIVSDIPSNKVSANEKSKAKEIVTQTRVTYSNILPDKIIEKQILSQFDYVPVTLFVNSKGKILETFTPGSTKYEYMKKTVEDILSGKIK